MLTISGEEEEDRRSIESQWIGMKKSDFCINLMKSIDDKSRYEQNEMMNVMVRLVGDNGCDGGGEKNLE